MTQEEKQLLLADLCARLPYGVKVHLDTDDKNFDTDLVGLTSNITANIHNTENYETVEECFIWNIKPYLRPMSNMTEEEKKEYTSYVFEQPFLQKDKTPNLGSVPMCIDWLNKKMFDYRGLIPMGLALEAKEGMYKTD